MNRLIKMLPALALVLAATIAMAMNFANPSHVNDPKFGSANGNVYDVTHRTMGPGPLQYRCNIATSDCLYEDSGLVTPVPDIEGQFVPGSGLTPIED